MSPIFKTSKPEPKNKEDHHDYNYPLLTNFSIKAKDKSKTLKLAKRMLNMPGIRGFEMKDDGTLEIAAEVHPALVVKILASSDKKKKDEKGKYSGAVGGYNNYSLPHIMGTNGDVKGVIPSAMPIIIIQPGIKDHEVMAIGIKTDPKPCKH